MTAGPVTTHRSAGCELLAAVGRRLQPSGPAQAADYAPRLFPRAESSPALLNHYPDIRLADLDHAAKHEQAETLDDLLCQRTGIGWNETMGREGARKAAETVADMLGWDEVHIGAEVAAFDAHLDHAHRRPTEA
jgi:glycerol-3-phosphate dehydrogenase